MATPSKTEVMQKLARLEKGTANINRLIVANLRHYSELEQTVSSFVSSPNEDTLKIIDEQFEKCTSGLEAIRNAVAYVAMTAIDIEPNPEDEVTLSGVEEGDGIRLM